MDSRIASAASHNADTRNPAAPNGRSAALITNDGRAVLADDTGPTSAGDHNGRSAALTTGDWHPVLAGDGGPTTAGDHNG